MIPLCQRDDDTKPTTTKGFLKSIGRGLGEIGQLQNFLSLGWNVAWLKWLCPNHSPLSNLRIWNWKRYSVNHKQIPNASELFEGSSRVVYLEHHNNPSKGSSENPYFTFSSIIEAEQQEEKGGSTYSFFCVSWWRNAI